MRNCVASESQLSPNPNKKSASEEALFSSTATETRDMETNKYPLVF